MSAVRPLLNLWLKLTEKPHLAKASIAHMRRSFETKARLLFHAPFGTGYEWTHDNGIDLLWVRPKNPKPGPVIYYIHGGAFIFGSPNTHKAMLARLCRETGLSACLIQYRLAPEHAFPAAPDDVLAGYQSIADAPDGVIIGGDSAGGNLALGLLATIIQKKLPMPQGVFALSPVTDLTFQNESLDRNAQAEAILPISRIRDMGNYIGDADPTDPRLSPINAKFAGAPPVWLAVGTTEILYDDSVKMAKTLKAQGVETNLTIEQDLPHVWPIFHNLLPEARKTICMLAAWISSQI